MTLKNSSSSFSMMFHTVKRKIWLFALVTITFFFSLPVGITLVLQRVHRELFSTSALMLVEITTVLEDYFSTYSVNNVILIILGIIASMTFFGYLHNKKKMDFYHSQPISMEKHFFVNYISGALTVLIPYLIFYLIALAVVGNFGDFSCFKPSVVLSGFLFPATSFLVTYSLGVLAAVLTGNIVIQGCGTLFFLVVIPAITAVFYALQSAFFQTFSGVQDGLLESIAYWSSPLFRGFFSDTTHGVKMWECFPQLIITVAIIALALVLFRRRKNELAGKAVVFPWFGIIVKYVMIIVGSLSFAIFFDSFGEGYSSVDFWLVFGALVGALLISRGMEVILSFDFKSVKTHWGSFVGCLLIIAGIIGCFALDITGYDRYLPDEREVESVSFEIFGFSPYGDDHNQEIYYEDISRRVLTDTQDKKAILELAQNGIAHLKDKSSDAKADYAIQEETAFSQEAVDYQEVSVKSSTASMSVTYQLKNGKKVTRYYDTIDKKETLSSVESIFTSEEFRKRQLKYLDDDQLTVNSIYFYDTEFSKNEKIIRGAEARALASAYKTDAQTLTLMEWESEVPLGEINFVIGDSIGFPAQFDIRTPIYPSYKNTLKVLASWGYSYEEYGILKAENIINVTKCTYDKSGNMVTKDLAPEKFADIFAKTYPSTAPCYFLEPENTVEYYDYLFTFASHGLSVESTRSVQYFWNK